jgi:hypothetical protein
VYAAFISDQQPEAWLEIAGIYLTNGALHGQTKYLLRVQERRIGQAAIFPSPCVNKVLHDGSLVEQWSRAWWAGALQVGALGGSG